MENSSNALIMAGEILIGIMVVSLLVYVISMFGNFSKTMQDQMDMSSIENFNSHFLDKQFRIDLTSNDIISTINFAREWNLNQGYTLGGDKASHSNDTYYVTVLINDGVITYDVFDNTRDEKTFSFKNVTNNEEDDSMYKEKVNKFLNENVENCFSCACTPLQLTGSALDQEVPKNDPNKKYYKKTDYKNNGDINGIKINNTTGRVESITFYKINDYNRQGLANIVIL